MVADAHLKRTCGSIGVAGTRLFRQIATKTHLYPNSTATDLDRAALLNAPDSPAGPAPTPSIRPFEPNGPIVEVPHPPPEDSASEATARCDGPVGLDRMNAEDAAAAGDRAEARDGAAAPDDSILHQRVSPASPWPRPQLHLSW